MVHRSSLGGRHEIGHRLRKLDPDAMRLVIAQDQRFGQRKPVHPIALPRIPNIRPQHIRQHRRKAHLVTVNVHGKRRVRLTAVPRPADNLAAARNVMVALKTGRRRDTASTRDRLGRREDIRRGARKLHRYLLYAADRP